MKDINKRKSGDRNRLKPYVNRLMSPRVSRPISLPIQFNQLPQSIYTSIIR